MQCVVMIVMVCLSVSLSVSVPCAVIPRTYARIRTVPRCSDRRLVDVDGRTLMTCLRTLAVAKIHRT